MLRLEPGLRYSQFEPASDIPPGTVLAEAPLFPGAIPTTGEQERPSFGCPETPYLKSALAAFLLPAGREESMEWYRQAMAESGYTETGHSSSGIHREIQSMGIQFKSLNHPGLELQLSFHSLAPGQTHVLYVATAVVLPPRPLGSYLGRGFDEVEITYRFPFSGMNHSQRIARFTVSDADAVEDLVSEIDLLTDVAAGLSHGGLDRGESATLIFRKADSTEFKVEVRYGRYVTVNETRPLVDLRMRVWRLVTRLVNQLG